MLDPERQHRYESSYSVSFPTIPSFTDKPREITVYQGMGKHDIVEMYYSQYTPTLVKLLQTGTPIQVTYNNQKYKETFVGYVTTVSYPVKQAINKGITIKSVGASYPLKDRPSKIWKDKTIPEVAIDVAKTFGLTPIVTTHPVKVAQQSLAGHSYWEKLQENAHRLGWACHMKGVELHFHPIDVMVDKFMTSVPVLSFADTYMGFNANVLDHTLDYFEPLIDDFYEEAGYGRTNKTSYGVNPISSEVYTTTSSPNTVGKNLRQTTKDPLFSSVETNVVSDNQSLSQARVDGKAQLSRLSIPAKGLAQGDPRIAPWRTVQVKNTSDSTDGYWVVESAVHTLHIDGRYKTEFKCLTDGLNQNLTSATRPSISSGIPTVNIQSALSTSGTTAVVSPTLVSTTNVVNQSKTGFSLTPNRWVGR